MGYHILIADDEPLEREALAEIVARHPELRIDTITLAESGPDAVQKAEPAAPDIAFLDIKMPGMDGLEVAHLFRDRYPTLRLVFLTAFDYFDYAREAIRVHADDFIVKPAEDEYVVRLLGRLVESLDHQVAQETAASRQETRLHAVTEFIRSELLDHLVAGDPDLQVVRRGLEFLNLSTFLARAITIRFAFDRYPLPVKTSAQERALTNRAIRLALRRMEQVDSRILSRSDSDTAYLLFLFEDATGPLSDDDATIAWLSDELRTVGEQNQLRLAAGLSPLCRTATALLAAFPQSRSAAGRAFDRILAGGADWAAIEACGKSISQTTTGLIPQEWESQLLAAVSTGNTRDADNVIEKIVAALATAIQDQRASVTAAATELESLTEFLARTLRIRGHLNSAEPIEIQFVHLGWTGVSDRFRDSVRALMSPVGPGVSGTVRRMVEYVDSNFRNDISLEDLAAVVQITPAHCSRLFSQELGIPFLQYLAKRRTQAAKRLLAETTLTINEIAAEVGFSDPNYFTRVFTRKEGVSPRVFREQVI